MKTFSVTFLISTAASICLWQLGLGNRIWPAHPFLAALATAIAAGIVVQVLISSRRIVPTTSKN
jgi:hypothetical protein